MADESSPRRLIVDAKIAMAALVRDGRTRHLLLSPELDLSAPEVLWDELGRNRAYLLKKSGATSAAYDLLVRLLRSKIRAIPLEVLESKLDEAVRRLGPEHRLDAIYLAAALAIEGTLWTHDKGLKRRASVTVVTTDDVFGWTGK